MSSMNDDHTTMQADPNNDYTDEPTLVPDTEPQQQGVQPEPQGTPVLQHVPVAPVAPVTGLPIDAADVDLIEKEWVEKAKQIVDSTTGDPYTQAKQLGQMKAEYVRKRYGRDLKTDG